MKRVLMVQPVLDPPGGGNGVAAWMLEALKDDHQLALLAWQAPDLPAINRFFGTSLRPSDFHLILPPRLARAVARRSLITLSMAKYNYLLLQVRRLARHYDLIVTANNESDFGRRGIQYIHFPRFEPIRPSVDLRWYNRPVAVANLYRRMSNHLMGFSMERMRRNLSLVNSDFTGANVRALHGVDTVTLYPPVAGDFPAVPWERREDGFVCIGRISPEKRIEEIIDILAKVRADGLTPHLHIVGTPDHDAYATFIRSRVEANRSWVSLHENVARDELAQLVSGHRYGMHAMEDEPFGMAVAEMVKSGSIVFAHNSAGPAEILGDQRLLYSSTQAAAEKIALTMRSCERQNDLREHIKRRSALFSAQRFVKEFRDLVKNFE